MLVSMNSRITFAGTLFVVCLSRTCVGASFPGDGVNNTPGNASDCNHGICNPVGTLNVTCNDTTADCLCRNGYEGPNCTDCQNGYYHHSNKSAECVPCQCDEGGSLSSSCDRFGACSCKPGVGGRQCNRCLSGYYDLSASGCQRCTCEEIAISCLYISRVRESPHSSMCHNCLLNKTWVHECTKTVCGPDEYLLSDGICTPCQCSQSQGSSGELRHCDLMTGKCPKCEGESCPTKGGSSDSGHFQYRAYIIASGAVAGLIVLILAVLLTVYCRRRCRRHTQRTPLPLWTIELRRDDEDECNATQELAFDDMEVMYLDDSYLMAPSSEHLAESSDNIIRNGRAGYHTLR
ncbi:multiple epidermal growth factor-like domains protein 9 [Acanthaster planci]|uniref:Multiple epidermal growth factor-like domains protein 9 n=1 Tax=Acanthaster planci TaxID=133434 RepID=A0A8B7XTX9_ACAPL|nr:multiple epidermal growth factor-like domains protein 9 [Acanthaster planci]